VPDERTESGAASLSQQASEEAAVAQNQAAELGCRGLKGLKRARGLALAEHTLPERCSVDAEVVGDEDGEVGSELDEGQHGGAAKARCGCRVHPSFSKVAHTWAAGGARGKPA